MAILYALLVVPVLALVDQSVALSMTGWACRGHHGLALHLVHAGFALATAAGIGLAWQSRRDTADGAPNEPTARRHWFAGMAIAASTLSLLVILTMWFPTWLLSSCLE